MVPSCGSQVTLLDCSRFEARGEQQQQQQGVKWDCAQHAEVLSAGSIARW